MTSTLEEYDKILADLKAKDNAKFSDTSFKNDSSCYAPESKLTDKTKEYDYIRAPRLAHFTDEEGDLEVDAAKASPLDV